MTNRNNQFIPLLRPASSFTLPQGVKWEYTQAPASLAAARPDLPRSAAPHGVIAIDRELTVEEIEHFDLQPLRKLVREMNALAAELRTLRKKLERMEAHEGEDGAAEDVDGQCALVEDIAVKARRLCELRAIVYPKK